MTRSPRVDAVLGHRGRNMGVMMLDQLEGRRG